MQEDVS